MLINKIILNNYRLYEGENTIIHCCGVCMDVLLAIFLFQDKMQATILLLKRET